MPYFDIRSAMTRDEVNRTEKCPDCWGDGRIATQSRNWAFRSVKCARCNGTGLVKRAAEKENERD